MATMWAHLEYESEALPLAAAWLRRKWLESRMIALETVKLLVSAMTPNQPTNAGVIEVSADAMLAVFGQGV